MFHVTSYAHIYTFYLGLLSLAFANVVRTSARARALISLLKRPRQVQEVKQANFLLFLELALVLASTFLVKTKYEARARNILGLFFINQSKHSF